MNPITPTVGRVVLVRSNDSSLTGAEPDREVPGLVTRVWSDTCINISIQRDGPQATPLTVTSVTYEDDPEHWGIGTTWRWMPYQKAVAAGEAEPVKHAAAPRANHAIDGFSFSAALVHVKDGGRAARIGWNGKGMFIFLVPDSKFTVNREPLLSILGEGAKVDYHGHIDMKTADGQIVPWLASQTDLLADDWQVA